MEEFICNNCGKLFKRYKSQVIFEERVCCSKECSRQFTVKSGRLKGENNPMYKHGKYCEESYCECGNIKDSRSEKCSRCSKKGYVKEGATPFEIDIDLIVSTIPVSISLQDVSRKTNYSRYVISKIVKKYNIDISHFRSAKGREIDLNKIFCLTRNRQNAVVMRYILKYNLIPYKCADCGLESFYNGKKLVLQLHHIDGNNLNNKLENLTILCPNCHSQTDNFTGKNSKYEKN